MAELNDILDRLLSERMRGQLRHMLTMLGPLLASHGVTSETYWQIVVGVLMALLALVDSWRRK